VTYETNKQVRAEDSADPDGLPDRRLTCASNGVNAERLR
jgi:hypothetical protein